METKQLFNVLLSNLTKESNETDSLMVRTKLLQLINQVRSLKDEYEYILK